MKYDFSQVKDAALSRIDSVLAHLLPGGKRQGSEYVVKNPRRADKSARSFSININTGIGADFATGDTFSDLIQVWAYIENCSQGEACKRLASFLGLGDTNTPPPRNHSPAAHQSAKKSPDWTPIFPVPDSALASRPTKHPKLGKPSKEWLYNDSQARPLLWVMRFDVGKGEGRRKEYRPLVYALQANGQKQWTWRQPPDKRPLYGLEYLGDNAATPVLLVEGEKAADRARQLFPGAVVMTWLSGSKAIGKADFEPLRGRIVWYWPDNDEAGKESIKPLSKALKAVGVDSFSLLDIGLFDRFAPSIDNGSAVLSQGPGDGTGWPEKADAADAVAMGWSAEHIDLLQAKGLIQPLQIQAGASPAPKIETSPQEPGGRFRSNEKGLYALDLKTESYRRIGGRLDVIARSRNMDGKSWGLLVSFDDFDGHKKEWNISSHLFATEGGAEIIRGLLDRGYSLQTSRDAKKKLLEYLGDFKTTNRVRLVTSMGWHGDTAFMLPDRVIGTPNEPLHFYSDSPPLCKMTQAGTLDQWKANVSNFCKGNPLLTFAVSTAFASPLIEVLGTETMGFHIKGTSSLGKSTATYMAASVYGSPKKGQYPQTWRATSNGLEGVAAAHTDCLLILDEIGEVDKKVIGETVYMLGNGVGKIRATETGGSRGVTNTWRLVFLSSGEDSLGELMAEANQKPKAGMEMRLLTIPACSHDSTADIKRFGIYHNLHGFDEGADLSTFLHQMTSKYHGTAIIAFLELLTKFTREELVSTVSKQRAATKSALLTKGASGQVHRAADKFALIAAAGELATMAGITGWTTGEATKAAENCFNSWLMLRGGAGNLEDKQALDHVRLMLSKYGESKFSRWERDDSTIDEHAPRTMERWGFRKTEVDNQLGTSESVFYLESPGFKDLCKGLDHKRVARLLNELGALEVGDNDDAKKRLQKNAPLPGTGRKYPWCVTVR